MANSAAHQKLNSKRTVDGSKTSLSNSSDRLPNANFAEDSALDLTGMDMWLPSRVAYIEAELKQRELHVCIEEVSFRSNMLFKPPEFLTSFLNLRTLDLSNNNLSILPSGLATACRNLNRLGLSDNNFRRVPPGVKEMTKLSTLDLSFNKLKDITSAAFPDQLTVLYLHKNQITVLGACLDNLVSLCTLNLAHNQLRRLPALELPRLVYLNLNGNSLSRGDMGTLRPQMLLCKANFLSLFSVDLSQLTEINLSRNKLQTLPDLPNLKTLNASSNQIQLLPNLLYKQVIPLKKNVPLPTNCDWDNTDNDRTQSSIDIITPDINGDAGLNKDSNTNKEVGMSRDEIKSPSDSQSELGTTLHKLQRVTSDQAEILGSEEMSPRRRMSAETARVSGLKAEVQRIPMQPTRVSPSTSSLQTPPKYKKRSPNINPPTSNSAGISTVSTPPSLSSKGTWGKRRKSKNMRNHYPSQNLCAIEVLLLGKNKLQTDCLLDSISQMSSLKELHLSHNNINELGHLRNLTSLRLLNMNSNSCMNVHSDVEYLSNLRSLSLCNNRLSLLPLSMSKLSKLEMLDLSKNNIRYAGIHSWMWTSNPSVRVLNLARNKYLGITNLADIASLPNLEFISLAGVILPCRCKTQQTSAGLLDLYSRSASETQACSICFTASVPANLIKTICLEPKDYPKPDTLIRKATARNSFPSSAYASPEGTFSATAITALTAEEATEKDIGLPVQSGVAQSNMNVKTIGQYSFTLNGIDFSELETAKSTFTIAKTHRVYGVFDAYGPTMADSHSSDNQKNVYHPNSVASIAYENFMPTFWEAIGRAFDGIDINNNITRSLRRAVLRVNRVVAERLPESNQYEGCSMAVLCMSRSRVWAANCGTTLSVLCRNGRAMPLSAKHTAKDEEERKRVLQRGADVSACGELFGMTEATRGLGMFALQPFMNAGPHVVDHHISHDDEFIITACHGLWSCMSFQYAVEVVRHEYSPERAAQTLRDRATMLGVQRPITVVVTFTPKIRRAVRKEGLTTSLITHQTQDRSNAEVPPPHGKVTLVFTDIQDSTELWEEEEEAMRDAVRIHNELMRKLLLEHGGYEVKTEGDAFMVAFETSHAALKWALHAQTSLTETVWSEEILSRRSCREVMAEGPDGSQQTVFRGLRVRMGIHTGCPDCEADPITGRMDYFGPMVNRSARVSAIGQGGQIISKHVWEEVESSLGPDTEVSVLGSYNLKGMKQKETIRQILPKTLHCRLEFFKKICAPPPPPIKVQSPISTQREQAIAHKSMSSPLHQSREKANMKRNDLAPATKPII
ncbi:hypothetical protein, variant [Sphaeroforma arctica JP610]|uniref:Adenylate cyclase n=1 Tax=Sphaeroforma arctica JP610 TaxID=667725 RepID=A0A0L0FP58_9EUKA|nr:hypothetical protein, variant [Sphaeroforma arctica JP610]KNC77768.1 hypothetical protein, variant [Sphaeroforma arctica JP610]|eukprot:XP_014151670.1 hypothetical protein, variant [Sphaeroforma arctica JP610]